MPAYADRDGNRWETTGQHAPDGTPLVICPNPVDPDDYGDGDPKPWRLDHVALNWAPLIAADTLPNAA